MALPPRGGGRFNPRFQRQQEPEHRINDRIRVPQVRLVGDNVEVGVYSTQEALKIAQEQDDHGARSTPSRPLLPLKTSGFNRHRMLMVRRCQTFGGRPFWRPKYAPMRIFLSFCQRMT